MMNRRKIDSYFLPVQKKQKIEQPIQTIQSETGPSSSSREENIKNENIEKPSQSIQSEVESPSSSRENRFLLEENIENENIFDIGKAVGRKMNDYEKYNFIKNTWHPPRNHVLPFSEHNKNNRIVKRYLNHDHLSKYEWLSYSPIHKGLYCKYCVVFAQVSGRNKTECLKSLVRTPVTKFSKLFGKDGVLDIHDSNKYHKEAILRSNSFVNCYENPTFDIRNVLSEGRKRQVEENRKRLVPIIRSVIFLARQNIPFRGHRDDGELCNTSRVNEGNFRELLRFRIEAGDRILEEHLRSTSSKATYISKTTQNQLIHFCSVEIISTIISKIKSAKFYSIMFDETTDISHVSQMSLVVRYLEGSEVKEDFVGFIDCHTEKYKLDPDTMEPVLTGKILGQIVVSQVKKLNLPFMDCVGICTDGCSVMTSKQNGAVQEAQKMLISSVRCPCLSHALNLSLSKSSSVQSVRNAMGVMKDVVSFFTASSKRNYVLKHILQGQLHSLCETRWVERHDSVLQFRVFLPKIVQSLNIISSWEERDSSSKAQNYSSSLKNSSFIVSLFSMSEIFSVTMQLSKLLQKKNLDLGAANDAVLSTLVVLKENRQEAEKHFKRIFINIGKSLDELGSTLSKPRTTGIMRHRPNPSCESLEEYYRQIIYIPLLDSIITDLESRFTAETTSLFNLNIIIPTVIREIGMTSLDSIARALVKTFNKLFHQNEEVLFTEFKSELSLWKAKWVKNSEEKLSIPDEALGALAHCDKVMFPLIRSFFEILITLPISVASSERSFSSLRRIKSWLRSTISEDRLSGLAIINAHPDIEINEQLVINRFANSGPRHMDFVL